MDETSERRAPASVYSAWGRGERPGKGPAPGLTVERVVLAGIAVADSQGLPAVSMGRVAAELGTSAMTLYRYVASKSELLLLMVDLALGPPEPDGGAGWRAALEGWACRELAAFRRHRWALRVPITGPPITPNELRWFEQGLACLRSTTLTTSEKPSVVLLVSSYVRSSASWETDIAEAIVSSGLPPRQGMAAYNQMVRDLAPPHDFPELYAVLDAGTFDADDSPDDEFLFGLHRILDGLEALISSRAARD